MTSNFHNASHQEFAHLMSRARHKFKVQLDTRTMNESTMRWVLKHSMATQEEKKIARQWIRDHRVTR
jgi:hypothetical protein